MQENYEIFSDLKKKEKSSEKEKEKKKALKMTSQLVIFRAFLLFFHPPDTKSEKKIP